MQTAIGEAPEAAVAFDLVVRGQRVLTSAGIQPREVGIRDGKVHALRPMGVDLVGETIIELPADEVMIPGLVDTHVHVNEPGRTEWEGFASATRAAAAGGVTTIIDMPLNSIPSTVTVDALEQKQAVAAIRPSSTSASGAAPSPATSRTFVRCTTPACSVSSASCSTRVSTSSRRSMPTRWRRRCGSSASSTRC
ncbi:amidohydrolase family protein [Tessaracoccus lubricantis]|uniref:amidohydrolase family protein n=1 Tax=Tessaracoccus lubricantis TaxID=545543 RepID=UPI0031EBA9FA